MNVDSCISVKLTLLLANIGELSLADVAWLLMNAGPSVSVRALAETKEVIKKNAITISVIQ